ncbi:MAG: ribose 5-phosphate isomerase B [Dehalococcoidales bacterium]|jgi:ribose 5-phosphate isomerase B|nr:ribose 5-phosphate isomerase B [Dehalococcoidales bacterium]
MRIAIGCDHRGLDTKQLIMELLRAAGHEVSDLGAYTTESADYPDIAREVATAVARGDFERGILICNTGIGMSMAANKVKGIRAALCCNTFMASRARQHNDANVLCLSTELGPELTGDIVKAYLNADFEGGRHQRRVDKIMALEG